MSLENLILRVAGKKKHLHEPAMRFQTIELWLLKLTTSNSMAKSGTCFYDTGSSFFPEFPNEVKRKYEYLFVIRVNIRHHPNRDTFESKRRQH